MIKRIFCVLTTTLCLTFAAHSQRMAVLSDIHVVPGNDNDRALRAAVSEINSQPFDLVIVNGDLTNEGSDAQIANVKSILDGITHRLYVLPGNHENTWSQSATKTFVDTFGNDRFVTEVDSLVIVGINCGPYMKMGDGHIKQEDLHWLRATLDSCVTPGKRVFSFNHYPIRQDDLDNWRDYADLLLQYPVIGHINGHYHRFNEYKVGDIPAIEVRALDMRDGRPGYTVVEIDGDWTFIYNKVIGHPQEALFAFANKTAHRPLPADKEARMLRQPDGFSIARVWADSASVFTRLGFDRANVYFGTSTGQVKAVDKLTGQLRWTRDTGAPLFSRPVVTAKDRVAIPYHGGVAILDTRNGRLVRDWPSAQGPYVADGLVTPDGKAYIQGGYKRLERRNPRTGKLVWSYDSIDNYCQAAPAVTDSAVIFGAWDTNLRSVDLRTGRLNWVWNNGKAANMLGPGNVVPVVNDRNVIVVAPDRYMTALDRRTGRQLWRDKSHKYRESLGHSADGTVAYAKTMDGELVAVDAYAPFFRELWTVDMGIGYDHAPCVVVEHDGVVYAGSRRGIVTAVDPATQTVLWSEPLGVSEVNGIDVDPANGHIYVSLIEGTLFRIAKL